MASVKIQNSQYRQKTRRLGGHKELSCVSQLGVGKARTWSSLFLLGPGVSVSELRCPAHLGPGAAAAGHSASTGTVPSQGVRPAQAPAPHLRLHTDRSAPVQQPPTSCRDEKNLASCRPPNTLQTVSRKWTLSNCRYILRRSRKRSGIIGKRRNEKPRSKKWVRKQVSDLKRGAD